MQPKILLPILKKDNNALDSFGLYKNKNFLLNSKILKKILEI